MKAFTGERVLVTGANGFLGSHVMDRVKKLDCEYYAVDHKACDLTDNEQVIRVFKHFRPDTVLHLAALCGGIGANQKRPGEFWSENLRMGINILDQCANHAVRKLVLMGTTCSYPKNTPVPFKEESLWSGYPEDTNAPYGIAKRCLIEGASAYRRQYDLDTTVLIPTNLYGPRDHFDPDTSHVIPALIRKCLEQPEHLQLWGTGTPTRDFLYVEDCADAVLLAAASDSPGPINLGSGREISIFEVAKLISDMTGSGRWISFDKSRPDGQPKRALDSRLAEKVLGWKATTPIEFGLRKTIDWYLSHCETKRKCL